MDFVWAPIGFSADVWVPIELSMLGVQSRRVGLCAPGANRDKARASAGLQRREAQSRSGRGRPAGRRDRPTPAFCRVWPRHAACWRPGMKATKSARSKATRARKPASKQRYGAKASEKVERSMHEMKRGELRSGG